MAAITRKNLRKSLDAAINRTPVVDFHTHLFTPCHGAICWWGIDDLLTYHYLVTEAFMVLDMKPDAFYAMPKKAQAELVWKTLFLDRTPLSEACRGVLTCLSRFGLDPAERKLEKIRAFYRKFTVDTFIDKVFTLADVEAVYMTNDPLDPDEREVWKRGHRKDPRFRHALRVDNFFRNAEFSRKTLAADGYPYDESLDSKSMANVRGFFDNWAGTIKPEYIAASLPPDFEYPSDTNPYAKMVREVMLPIARERGLPVALMIGVRRLVNPPLRAAGDGLGIADVRAVENLCRENPDIRFLCTMIARENQSALAVTAFKFPNLKLFGCWWFMNNPGFIEEITRMRLELLGTGFIPQHSDCRVMDQLLYKWDHSRAVIAKVLEEKYGLMIDTGYGLTEKRIRDDVELLLAGNVRKWAAGAHAKG